MRRWLAGAAIIVAGAIGATGCSTTVEVADTPEPAADADPVAYGYFGEASVARGSSLETTIQGVDSSADVSVVDSPDGVTASVIDADDGATRLQLAVADDAAVGAQTITFEITGEPEPISWAIQILSP